MCAERADCCADDSPSPDPTLRAKCAPLPSLPASPVRVPESGIGGEDRCIRLRGRPPTGGAAPAGVGHWGQGMGNAW
eukprot:10686723-Alexandrium_andersonii.AAC.1